MDAHGVEVFDGTDDDHVVHAIAHDLKLVFLPPDHRFLDEDLLDPAGVEAKFGEAFEILFTVNDASSRASHGKAGPDNAGKADFMGDLPRLIHIVGEGAFRQVKTDAEHGLLEFAAVFRPFDGVVVGSDELHAVPLEHAVFREFHGGIEPGLASHGGEKGVRAFPLDDFLHDLRCDGLDVGLVGHGRIGHDGGRI